MTFVRVLVKPDLISQVLCSVVSKSDRDCGSHIARKQILGAAAIVFFSRNCFWL